MLENIVLGLETALSLWGLIYCALGVALGTFIGVIPGIGAIAAIAVLFPITFHLDLVHALVMLGGIYYGATYGGSTASILLNLPGTPANAVTCLDGYPMAKSGRAGVALFMTTVASFVGGTIGILVLMFFSPVIVDFALEFGPWEYFSLMTMGLIAASMISAGSPLKGIAMVFLGILLGVIGIDMYTGLERYTFGVLQIMDGLNLIAFAMGIFGVAEVVASIGSVASAEVNRNIRVRDMFPTREDIRRSLMPMARGAGIGCFFGALPGTGGTIAAFMSYVTEKKVAKDPSRFGKGAIEGIMGPETANNSADQTAFIPTLTLGVPGNATMALMLGVLIIHGIAPGPSLMTEQPNLFWGLVMSFWIGNILLLILNLPLIGIWVRVLTIPYSVLYPSVILFICLGVYTANNNPFDVYTVVFFGALGYLMRLANLPAAPLLLGFILGPLMEEHFRRAMIISDGNPAAFVQRPLSAAFLLATCAIFAWSAFGAVRRSAQDA